MKVRYGFVANSSSSSFVIGCKGELTKEKIMEAFKVSKDSPIYPIVKEMAEIMINNVEVLSKHRWKEDYYEWKVVQAMIKRGQTVYIGTVGDEGEPIEAALTNIDLMFSSDDFSIWKEGGY